MLKSTYVSFTYCTVLPKKNEHAYIMAGVEDGAKARRTGALVFGEFPDRKSFNKALLNALSDSNNSVWDLRTIKFHGGVSFTQKNNDGHIIAIDDIREEQESA